MRRRTVGLLGAFALAASLIVGLAPAALATNYNFTQTIVGNGTVTGDTADVNGTIISCPGDCTGSYPAASTLTLTEEPDAGWHFDHWNGSVCENDVTVTCTITFNANRSITATFTKDTGTGLAPLVLIMMENHNYGQVSGSSFFSGFGGRVFTNYFAIRHPSLPNYFAITAGSTLSCTTDGCPLHQSSNNVFNQLNNDWETWAESMPRGCFTSNQGKYVRRHNPAVYYSDLEGTHCNQQDIPYPTVFPDPDSLAPFTFVVPNNCHNMHSPCGVSDGNTWLNGHVQAFLDAGAIVIVAFDEGTSSNNNVWVGVDGPGIGVSTNNTAFDHYNLLAGIEDYLSLSRLGSAVGKTALPIT